MSHPVPYSIRSGSFVSCCWFESILVRRDTSTSYQRNPIPGLRYSTCYVSCCLFGVDVHQRKVLTAVWTALKQTYGADAESTLLLILYLQCTSLIRIAMHLRPGHCALVLSTQGCGQRASLSLQKDHARYHSIGTAVTRITQTMCAGTGQTGSLLKEPSWPTLR